MTSFGEIVYGFGGIALRAAALLLLIGQLYCCIDAFYQKRSALCRVLMILQLSVWMFFLFVLLDGSYSVDYADRARTFSAPVTLLYRSPWLWVLALETVFAAMIVVSLVSGIRFRKSRLTRDSIKETVDMFPVGVCFGRADGVVELNNLRMEQLCRELTGKALSDLNAFTERIRELGEEQDGSRIVKLKSGEAILFERDTVSLGGSEYTQLTAFDISELYRVTSELKSKNEKLLDLKTRMRAFGERAAQLAMSEEILRARVEVHDELGHLLLSGKYYLDNPETADGESLVKMAEYTHRLLTREGEEPDDARRDSVSDAADVARAMGVSVKLEGELPQDEPRRALLGKAICECAANTVKHAGGDRLSVRVTMQGERMTAELTGSGSPPQKPITETGGLLLLRKGTEAAGGCMEVTAEEQVKVSITV